MGASDRTVGGELGVIAAGRSVNDEHAQRARIGVLVVDDHPAVRWGLVQLLEDQPDLYVAAIATTAEAAVTVADDVAADVVVVDYQLRARNGLWVTCRAKALDRPPGVVIFSACANSHLAANCAVAGADALLNMGSLGDDLCKAIRAVARGRRLIPRVSQETAGSLQARLRSEQERMILGMLLAGVRGGDIAKAMGIGEDDLTRRRGQILAKLETMPG